jgi:hypothetical protein
MDQVVQLKERTLATTDLDEARDILTRQYCSHSLFKKDRSAVLDVRYSHCSLLNTSVNCLQYGAEVDIRPEEFETFYLVHIPLAGRASIRAGGHRFDIGPGVAAIVSPSHEVSTTWTADCKQLMLKIDRKPLEGFLSHLIYQPIHRPLEFPYLFDLNLGLGASFYGLIQHLVAELSSREVANGVRTTGADFAHAAPLWCRSLLSRCAAGCRQVDLPQARGQGLPIYGG